jgi:hypothetical protein
MSRTAAVATLWRALPIRLGTLKISRDVGLRRAQSSRLAESGIALPFQINVRSSRLEYGYPTS